MHKSSKELVLIVVGIIARSKYLTPKIDERLAEFLRIVIGEMTIVSPVLDTWCPPVSYKNEMGQNLNHVLLLSRQLKPATSIIKIKYMSDLFEVETSIGDCRRFNVNPGFIGETGFYLASRKPSITRKRIPMARNCWIDQQYSAEQGSLISCSDCFSEYATEQRQLMLCREYRQFLGECQCLKAA